MRDDNYEAQDDPAAFEDEVVVLFCLEDGEAADDDGRCPVCGKTLVRLPYKVEGRNS